MGAAEGGSAGADGDDRDVVAPGAGGRRVRSFCRRDGGEGRGVAVRPDVWSRSGKTWTSKRRSESEETQVAGTEDTHGRGSSRAVLLLPFVVACATTGPPEEGATALPSIPETRGDLSVRVAYPDSNARIAARDSNFIFGTTGTGAAELRIDGRPVPVEPNGSFLAWIPVPNRIAGDTARYRLVARVGDRADTLIHPVLLPPEPTERIGVAWIDTASVGPMAERWALPEEEVELSVHAAPGLDAAVEVLPPAEGARPPARFPLTETSRGRYRTRIEAWRLSAAATPPSGRRRADANAARPGVDSLAAAAGDRVPGPAAADTAPDARPTVLADGPAPDSLALRFVVSDRLDTAVARGRLPLRVLDPSRPPVAVLQEEPDSVHGASGVVVGRPSPYGSYAWRFPDGSEALVDGRRGDRVRVRLAADLRAWVAAEDVRLLDGGGGAPDLALREEGGLQAGVGSVAARPAEDRIRVDVPVGRPLPASVSLPDPHTLALTVYGGLGGTERMAYGPDDPLLASLAWDQLPGPRYRLEVGLTRPVWGWRLAWRGRVLTLEVRRPPPVDRDDPLRGVRVAVDPGHPPAGAEGPTGLTEAAANLGVARRLAELLRERGAEPVLIRSDTAAVGLYERRTRAVDAGADLLVSIHNNALPDGVRPFGREGTSTYYFHPQSRPLARAVQSGMLRWMGLRDLGVRWGNLALPREPWMPSVLTEGAFMMFPRHEAALRTPAFRDAYARGVLDGLETYLRRSVRPPPSDG